VRFKGAGDEGRGGRLTSLREERREVNLVEG